MAENSTIEWTDHTFNPWEGCQKVGPGCDHCYAEARNIRFTGGENWGPGAPRRRTSAANWAKPLKWNRDAATSGTRPRVFCASLADVFDNAVDPAWRADLFDLIQQTPRLDWLLLTKRPGNIAAMLPMDWGTGWPNVWLGCTVVNQAEADRDIPKLLAVPAAVRFLSIEPMLGPVDLNEVKDATGRTPVMGPLYRYCQRHFPKTECKCPDMRPTLDWVICGGESGPGARPMHPDWARSLRDQCIAADVPFLFKQWGEWAPAIHDADDHYILRQLEKVGSFDSWKTPVYFDDPAATNVLFDDAPAALLNWRKLGKARSGRFLDGRTWDEVPHD